MLEPCNITVAAERNVEVWTCRWLLPSGRAWLGVCLGTEGETSPVAPALHMVVPWALSSGGMLWWPRLVPGRQAKLLCCSGHKGNRVACLVLGMNPGTALPFWVISLLLPFLSSLPTQYLI